MKAQTQTNNNIISDAIKFFTKNTGLTIAQAKRMIMNKMKIDRYSNDIEYGNVRLFYSDNKNFENGKGFYLAIKRTDNTFSKYIKL